MERVLCGFGICTFMEFVRFYDSCGFGICEVLNFKVSFQLRGGKMKGKGFVWFENIKGFRICKYLEFVMFLNF